MTPLLGTILYRGRSAPGPRHTAFEVPLPVSDREATRKA